jgi:formylglycine-generating enzyme required for sulfatase activity
MKTGDDNACESGAIPPQAIGAHRAALRDRLDDNVQAIWGGMAAHIPQKVTALTIEASPYHTGQLEPCQNLVETLHGANRLLVLGDAGSGKTVALQQLAWELCAGPEPVVPVLVSLFLYAGGPLADWVRTLLQDTGHLRFDEDQALFGFLKGGQARCTFLFDGLSEVPPPYRDRLAYELAGWVASYPDSPAIFTCRPQDEFWRRLRKHVGQVVIVQPVDPGQVKDYLVAHLGESKGGALYESLGPRARKLVRLPLILKLVMAMGATGESIPGNRGELYAAFVSRLLRRDTSWPIDAEIPESIMRSALAALAYHLGLSQRLTCPRDEAIDVVAKAISKGDAEAIFGACARQGLLADEETVWFTPHQTVQEYLAALALCELASLEAGMGPGPRLAKRVRQWLTRQPQGLAALAADDWWMGTFVQLAGLVEDADTLARTVARANPFLASRCMEEGCAVSEPTRLHVEDRCTRLLSSERVADRRRAVEALARMERERVLEPLFLAVGDTEPEVGNLALQGLSRVDESAREHAGRALLGTDRRQWFGALRYLVIHGDDTLCRQIPWQRMLGQPLVYVPAGPFLMGSDPVTDPQTSEEEKPQHQVTLPAFWIGRYPVTVAQFREFSEASGTRMQRADRTQGPAGHPAASVIWHEALAYCRWLGQKTGLPVMLPSEAEWEKAARGTDGRLYPWGNDWDSSCCNTREGKCGGTTPIGAYSPRGDSPYGCADMAGNVWEWTRSLWGTGLRFPQFVYPYDPSDGRENLVAADKVRRVLRGGSWYNDQRYARCTDRGRLLPYLLYYRAGFRVAVGPITSSLRPSNL